MTVVHVHYRLENHDRAVCNATRATTDAARVTCPKCLAWLKRTVSVRIVNIYARRESVRVVDLPAPGADIATWWTDVVFPETGDGKGGDSHCQATITRADDNKLVGLTNEWSG